MAELSRKRRWTGEDDRELAELRSMGLTSAQIAEKINRSRSGVEGRVYFLMKTQRNGVERIARHIFTETEDRVISEMHAAGSRSAAIAEATGLKADQVRGRVKVLKDKQALLESRNLESKDIFSTIQERKRLDELAATNAARSAKAKQAKEVRSWMESEVRWCRKLAKRHKWVRTPEAESADKKIAEA